MPRPTHNVACTLSNVQLGLEASKRSALKTRAGVFVCSSSSTTSSGYYTNRRCIRWGLLNRRRRSGLSQSCNFKTCFPQGELWSFLRWNGFPKGENVYEKRLSTIDKCILQLFKVCLKEVPSFIQCRCFPWKGVGLRQMSFIGKFLPL